MRAEHCRNAGLVCSLEPHFQGKNETLEPGGHRTAKYFWTRKGKEFRRSHFPGS